MKKRMEERVIKSAELLSEGSTVRAVAEKTGWSKSTIHLDVTVRIRLIDRELYEKCQEVLLINHKERCYRGGEATKNKRRKENEYKISRSCSSNEG